MTTTEKKGWKVPTFLMIGILAVYLLNASRWDATLAACVILLWWIGYALVVPYLLDEEIVYPGGGSIPAGSKMAPYRILFFLLGVAATVLSGLMAFGISLGS